MSFISQLKYLLILLLIGITTSSSLHAISYLKYDFRDVNQSFSSSIFIDAKSNQLPFDTFENPWETLPKHNQTNTAFGEAYSDIAYHFSGFKLGAFKQVLSEITINDGFVQTWYEADQNFVALLGAKNIAEELNNVPIDGHANGYDSNGIYLQKTFSLLSHHYVSFKAKFLYAKTLEYIDVKGQSSSDKFHGSVDYFYTGKNLITKGTSQSDESAGKGYACDIEYIYNNDDIYLYLGAYNLSSYIYWDNATYMHYDFDSQTTYIGADGYKKYKSFGEGSYQYNIKFKQKLPEYYKAVLNYELFDNLAIGNNVDLYTYSYYNELYVNYKAFIGRYKLGYIVENNSLVFATYFKNFSAEVSNNFSPSNNTLLFSLKVAF